MHHRSSFGTLGRYTPRLAMHGLGQAGAAALPDLPGYVTAAKCNEALKQRTDSMVEGCTKRSYMYGLGGLVAGVFVGAVFLR